MREKDLILLVVPMFFVVVLWIGFNFLHSSLTSTIPENLNVQITPIEGTFDKRTISELKKRETLIIDSAESTTASETGTEGAQVQ